MKEKFYEKTWFTILTLICVFPVGLILMWKNKKFNIHKTTNDSQILFETGDLR